jgi:hypothetical protein
MSIKEDLDGEVFLVLVEGEYAGWFSIPTGNLQTEILRSALSSDPKIINFTNLPLEISQLPAPADGWKWDGTTFKKD